MRAALVALTALAAVALPRAALADSGPLRLEWRAPAGCPSAKAVRDAAVHSAGEVATDGAPLDARADVEHAGRWRVTIQTSRDGTDATTRSLEASSCAALADATAVVLGVALIPGQRLEPPTTPAEQPASGGSEISQPPVASPAPLPQTTEHDAGVVAAAERPAAPAPTARGHRVAIGAEVAGDGGMLPAVAGGARVALAWTPGAFRVELSGAYFSGQSRTTETSAAGARLGLLTFGGRGCWAPLRAVIELGPCVGVDVQHMSGDGFGASTNYEASGTWAAAQLGGLLRVPLSPAFALRADVDAITPLTRPRFVVENDGAVHKPAGIGARAGIGAELNFL